MEVGTAAQWASASMTFAAVLVALFREDIRGWWRRPKLELRVSLEPPDGQKTRVQWMSGPQVITADCHYVRLWVMNKGKSRAEKVEVYLAALSRRRADGAFSRVETFPPMNLRWAHATTSQIFADGIPPGMGKHCDFGHVIDPGAGIPGNLAGSGGVQFVFDLEVAPNTGAHIVPPGVYRAHLQVAASNAKPIDRHVELTVSPTWYADEATMFREGLGLRLVDSAG